MSTPAFPAPAFLSSAVAQLRDRQQRFQKLFEASALLRERPDPALQEKRALTDEVCLELGLHAALEREFLAPALAQAAPDDVHARKRFDAELVTIESLVAHLARQRPDSSIHDATLSALEAQLTTHLGGLETLLGTFGDDAVAKVDMAWQTLLLHHARTLTAHRQQRDGQVGEDESADPVG
jgi:hypothetical protein